MSLRGNGFPPENHPQKFVIFVGCENFTKICPCGAMDSRLRGNDDERGRGGDVRV